MSDPLREAAQAVVDAWVDDESGMETFDPELIDALGAALSAVSVPTPLGSDCSGYKYGHCGCTCHPAPQPVPEEPT